MSLPIFATTVKLNLVGCKGAQVAVLGPFVNFGSMCKALEPYLHGWSRSTEPGAAYGEISVAIEFNYGDIIYRDIQYLYPPDKGGVESTLFWLDHSVHEWLAETVPGYFRNTSG